MVNLEWEFKKELADSYDFAGLCFEKTNQLTKAIKFYNRFIALYEEWYTIDSAESIACIIKLYNQVRHISRSI